MKWQTIDSAPIQTLILAYFPDTNGVYPASIGAFNARYRDKWKIMFREGMFAYTDKLPTHWMPIPSAPRKRGRPRKEQL